MKSAGGKEIGRTKHHFHACSRAQKANGAHTTFFLGLSTYNLGIKKKLFRHALLYKVKAETKFTRDAALVVMGLK